MKNLSCFCLILCLSLFCGAMRVQASNVVPTPPLTTEQTLTPRGQELTNRLEAIKAMDKSQLSSSERKALRKEVRHIKREVGGGVYISAGLLIVILIILILVL